MNFNPTTSKEAREKLGLPQTAIEGFDQSFISLWENRKIDPLFSTVERQEHFFVNQGCRFTPNGVELAQ